MDGILSYHNISYHPTTMDSIAEVVYFSITIYIKDVTMATS